MWLHAKGLWSISCPAKNKKFKTAHCGCRPHHRLPGLPGLILVLCGALGMGRDQPLSCPWGRRTPSAPSLPQGVTQSSDHGERVYLDLFFSEQGGLAPKLSARDAGADPRHCGGRSPSSRRRPPPPPPTAPASWPGLGGQMGGSTGDAQPRNGVKGGGVPGQPSQV